MFDPKRKFRTCAFCNCRRLTAEHLFGRGVAERAGLNIEWPLAVSPSLEQLEHAATVRAGAPILSFTSEILCETCNGSFSVVMNDVLEPLIDLFQRNRAIVFATESTSLLRYFERLAFLVDLVTSNHEVDLCYAVRPEHRRNLRWRSQEPVFCHAERKAWFERRPGWRGTRSPRVYLGLHRGKLGLRPQVDTGQSSAFDTPHSKNFQIAIHGLVVVLRMGEPTVREPSKLFVQLRAEKPALFPSKGVDYEDYFALLNQPSGHEELRRALRVPEYRLAYESQMQQDYIELLAAANGATA